MSYRSHRLSVALVSVAVLGTGAVPLAAQEAEETPRAPLSTTVPVEEEKNTRTIEMTRIALPSPESAAEHGYTISVPTGWGPRTDLPTQGVMIGPPSGDPSTVPSMLLVRESDVDVSDPEEILGNLRANAEREEWDLVEGEVRDFGGARGLWIVRRLPAVGTAPDRINAAAKLPLGGGSSLDVLATVPDAQWPGVAGLQVQYMLGSIRAAEPDGVSEPDGAARRE